MQDTLRIEYNHSQKLHMFSSCSFKFMSIKKPIQNLEVLLYLGSQSVIIHTLNTIRSLPSTNFSEGPLQNYMYMISKHRLHQFVLVCSCVFFATNCIPLSILAQPFQRSEGPVFFKCHTKNTCSGPLQDICIFLTSTLPDKTTCIIAIHP